jgi:hypothetical protein
MLAAIGLIVIASKLPNGGSRTQVGRAVSDADLENILPSGLPVYNKNGKPVRVPEKIS